MIPRPSHLLFAGLPLCCFAALVLSCASDPTKGYVWSSTYAADIHSVHVPIFQNSTFSRGIEIELTDAIIKEIQSKTPWRVVPADAASTTLTGAITDSRLRSLSLGRDSGLVQEQAVELTVQFEFKDNRTGKVLVARRNFAASDAFVPAQGLNERLETGQHGAIAKLARDIVAELRSSW